MKLNSEEILLWNGMRAGNEQMLRSLYLLYYDDLLRYGVSLTNDFELSRDYINLLFLSLWDHRARLTEVENPRAYIITSYKNKIIFRKKKAGELKVVSFETNESLPETTVSSIEQTLIELQEYQELKEKVNRILSTLTERQKQLMKLRFIEEMSYEEIAAKLDIGVRTVYNSIYESLKLLRG